jgi:hypothetical protein
VTVPKLAKKLEAIDHEVKKAAMPESAASHHPELEVTRMDMERLEISIKVALSITYICRNVSLFTVHFKGMSRARGPGE